MDIVPTPGVTPLMRYAVAAGCKIVGASLGSGRAAGFLLVRSIQSA
jgi:hypothetical protein